MWEEYDLKATGFINLTDLNEFVHRLGRPLGIQQPNRIQLARLAIPIYQNDRIGHTDLLEALTLHFFAKPADKAMLQAIKEAGRLRNSNSAAVTEAEPDYEDDEYGDNEQEDVDSEETNNAVQEKMRENEMRRSLKWKETKTSKSIVSKQKSEDNLDDELITLMEEEVSKLKADIPERMNDLANSRQKLTANKDNVVPELLRHKTASHAPQNSKSKESERTKMKITDEYDDKLPKHEIQQVANGKKGKKQKTEKSMEIVTKMTSLDQQQSSFDKNERKQSLRMLLFQWPWGAARRTKEARETIPIISNTYQRQREQYAAYKIQTFFREKVIKPKLSVSKAS
ncbi:unnamed protein product [Protopolystoma xenopodis]|uniref:EF-hand domain-containing protein n=1 Tax=Protopolystoma xenopodis TaxID=117903 RepID=A0A448WKE3_9PLAT|nr:unnamed protein product [Protopolystoma xenopodis]